MGFAGLLTNESRNVRENQLLSFQQPAAGPKARGPAIVA